MKRASSYLGAPQRAFPLPRGAWRLKRERKQELLLFVIERFAVRAYLDFRFLSIRINLGLVGNEFVFLGEGFDFEDFSFAGFGLQPGLDLRRQGIERNLLLDFNDGAIGGHRNILAVAVDRHF